MSEADRNFDAHPISLPVYQQAEAELRAGQFENAIAACQKILSQTPDCVEAYQIMAEAWLDLGNYEAAMQAQIQLAETHYRLGIQSVQAGWAADAIAHFEATIEIDPEFAYAYYNLGTVFCQLDQFEQAIACFEQVLEILPDADTYASLGEIYAASGQTDLAIAHYQSALEIQPDHAIALWRSHLVLPNLYDDRSQIQTWRDRFSQGLQKLCECVELNTESGIQTALRGLQHNVNFYLAYQGQNDRRLQQQYGELAHRIMAARYPKWVAERSMPTLHENLKGTGKLRIGYLSSFFHQHSIGRTTIGFLRHRDRQQFEIYTYYIGTIADAMTEEYQQESDYFHHIPNDLETVCMQIATDRLHVLIFPDIGMYAPTTQIAALRLAPIQCVTLGHPVTTGLPTIDYFLSSEWMELPHAQSHYSETLVNLPKTGMAYPKPVLPLEPNSRADFPLPEDAVIYLCCQSLFKYLPQYDYIFAAIAAQVPQAKFVFLAHPRSSEITDRFSARLSRTFAEFDLHSQDYCLILPQQERREYLSLHLRSDVFLDTLAWSGNNTCHEAIACGLPIVTCGGEFMRGRHAYAILQTLGIVDTIAENESDYIAIAVKLGLEPQWRRDIADRIRNCSDRLYDDSDCVRALENFLKERITSSLNSNC
ncbi:tetratricopeptide repeat protein [Tumidithrix elongata RA019]|uniref:protein O-GlcNAc transferase n=1 Tax=Tumidithrix elongata BACA0141 TaxID=2716417 RepID=A0AAW9Q6E1_9CYAN|nr:tetratricopeptide repeat protein [Tumidithrix elongata RA019]